MDSFDVSLGEPWAGAWEAGAARGNGQWLLCSLTSLTAKAPHWDVSGSWHTPALFFLQHIARECCNFLQGDGSKVKETLTALICSLLWSYRLLEAPCSCGQRELCATHHLCTPSRSCRRLEAPCGCGERELCATYYLSVKLISKLETHTSIGWFFWFVLLFGETF